MLDGLAGADDPDGALGELTDQWCCAAAELVGEVALGGRHDHHPALVSVRAGAGGADAREWAQQLFGMYGAWARSVGRPVELVDVRDGAGGLRSGTLRIGGAAAFGWLRGEAGVHRVAHLSRFGARGKRQTSFAAVQVLPQRPLVVGQLGAVRVETYRASGPGGQHRNTTDSAVGVTHVASGISAQACGSRSQRVNREAAFALLAARVRAQVEREHEDTTLAIRGDATRAGFGARRRSYVLHPQVAIRDDDGAWSARDTAILDGALGPALAADLLRRVRADIRA